MKIYPINLPGGRTAAFEIANWRVGRRRFCRIVSTIPGVVINRRPRCCSWFFEDVFCEFTVDGARFEGWEPYGDNSRYWIGPSATGINDRPLQYFPQIEAVIQAFERA